MLNVSRLHSFLLQSCMLTGNLPGTGRHDLPTRGIGAYRGASKTHPENTLAAFHEAIRLGAHMVEMDVQATRDRQLILMHDTTLDRTTNGSGDVTSLTLAQIKRFDAGQWRSDEFEKEQVPTLAEVFQIMPDNIWLMVHLRGGNEIAERVAQAVVDQKRLHQTIFVCGPDAAQAALNVDSSILLGIERALAADFREIAAGRERMFLFSSMPDLGRETPLLNVANISIIYCDPGPILPGDLPRLFDAGVHFVLTPDVDGLVKAAANQGIQPLKPQYSARNS